MAHPLNVKTAFHPFAQLLFSLDGRRDQTYPFRENLLSMSKPFMETKASNSPGRKIVSWGKGNNDLF